MFETFQQKLFFVIGKGGVGRSTISASLASYYAQKNQKVLVVQWALSDSISPIFSQPKALHKELLLPFQFNSMAKKQSFKIMNFNVDEAIKEYFIDHLKMKLIYSLIVQNKHVQKLIHAAPGISELFFLGRLFWLSELALIEKGFEFDKIIVDCPATGHGVSLFGIAQAVAQLGMTGPLAIECERVAKLLSDSQKTSVLLVTLPEELPVEECMESIPKIKNKLGYNPSAIFINQSVNSNIYPNLSFQFNEPWLKKNIGNFKTTDISDQFIMHVNSLLKRNTFEEKLGQFAANENIKTFSIPDFKLTQKQNSSLFVIESVVEFLNKQI